MADVKIPMTIDAKILTLRGMRVMLDRDLAELYGVPTKALNQAVKRNRSRFPEEFMFQLTEKEQESLRSQIVTLKRGQHAKYLPFAFTEHGVAMLSSVLNSEKAIEINILIIKAFIRLKNLVLENADLRKAVKLIESRLDSHDRQIQIAFAAIQNLLKPAPLPAEKHTIKPGFGPRDLR